jgi:hypothetical protein
MTVSFNNLKFNSHRYSDGVQALWNCGRYELSVVDMKGDGPLYEIAIFQNDKFVQLPGIHPDYGKDVEFKDDVIHHQSKDDITGIMKKLTCLCLDFTEEFGQSECDFR